MAELIDILKAVAQSGASDLHLAVGKPPMARLHGKIVPLQGAAAVTADECQSMIYSVLSESQRARFEERWELDGSVTVPGSQRFRLNVFRQKNGLGAVFRAIPAKIPTSAEIGLMPAIANLVDLPRGLVLVTGPTGSGKSTTLACLIESINAKHNAHVLTIEDPIEFVYEDKSSIILQREVGSDTLSFQAALRHALRQDPDVILVGELRDLETTQLAMTAAETGHLCLATLHTRDASSTIDRIIDVFPAHQQAQVRVQLAGSLKGVISQLLAARADGEGMIAVREMMFGTPALANLIREGKTHMIRNVIETGGKDGMCTMDKCLEEYVRRGFITLTEAEALGLPTPSKPVR